MSDVKPFLIAPQNEGLVNNVDSWLLPENAYSEMTNAYVWRGKVKKRFGYNLLGGSQFTSRLRINIGTTDGAGNISVTVPGSVFEIGQMFTIGSEVFTVNATGAPGTMLISGAATVATYNTTTGAVVINGADATTDCYFYPAQPVMGLRTRETASINLEDTIAFDTQFAYRRTGGAWDRLNATPLTAANWTGTDSNFYWTINYRSTNAYTTALWVVNNVSYIAGPPNQNGIQYINTGATTWNAIRPQLNSGATRFLDGGKIILSFKDRLLILNTLETDSGSQRFQNRVRWCQNGDPTDTTNGWLDDTPGRGGYVDAYTEEAIISADFIKDRLIVYFERSTWELVYTGDATLPFRWQQLNNELGVESSFSIVGFDQGIIGVGNVGVHSCNGVNVSRIDEKIPDEVFRVHNGNDGVERVYGIRDYFRELIYWTFPNSEENPTYPTDILVWNYQNNTWAFFKDSFTCFGYFQRDSDKRWQDLGALFGSWSEWNEAWVSGAYQSGFGDIVAGNQEGFVLVIDGSRSSNSPSLTITDMDTATQRLTVINHNLKTGDYVLISGQTGITLLQDSNNVDILTFQVIRISDDVIEVNKTPVSTTEPYVFGWTGTYTGGGVLARLSNIDITSKQWNPGSPSGRQFRLNYIDFLLYTTDSGEVTVNYYPDFNPSEPIQSQITDSNVLLGSNVLFTRPETGFTGQASAQKNWHRYFLQLEGQAIQIKIEMSNAQMRNPLIAQSEFEMDALILYVSPEGRITG